MSESALLQAVRDKLQAAFELDAESCEVMFDGQPKPQCGQLFLAVHPAAWTGESGDWDLDEVFGAAVTVTMRIGYSPRDRWGTEILIKDGSGLDAILRKALTALHKQYDVINAANTLLATSPVSQFIEPLVFQNAESRPVERGPDWFSAAAPEDDLTPVEAGVSRMLTFSGARRVQGPASDEGLS